MPKIKARSCSVPSCPGNTGYSWDGPAPLKFYAVPSVISENNKRFSGYGQEDMRKKIMELSRKRRKAWLQIIKREDARDDLMIKVCERHFISGRPAKLEDEDNPDWVPWKNVDAKAIVKKTHVAQKRRERHKLRERRAEAVTIYGGSMDPPVFIETDSDVEEVLLSRSDDESRPNKVSRTEPPTTNDDSVETNVETPAVENAESVADDPAIDEPSTTKKPTKEKYGHWHVHFCRKKSCLFSKEAAKHFAPDVASSREEEGDE